MSTVTLTAADGHSFDAYVVGPQDAPAGLVIVQEIFGVNAHIRSVADRAAEAGYRAIAPAFFDRAERGVELGYDGEGMKRGIGYAGRLDWDQTMADLSAAIDHLDRPTGVVGFCWGGTTAWLSASRTSASAAVGYYGGGVHSFIDATPTVPVMLHFGERDGHIPLEHVEAVGAAHPAVTIHTYDAEHGFHCDARDSYDPPSATTAWARTLEFFAANLG